MSQAGPKLPSTPSQTVGPYLSMACRGRTGPRWWKKAPRALYGSGVSSPTARARRFPTR